MSLSLFTEADIVLTTADGERRFERRNPPHVHQPLIQTIVDELRGRCESTGDSGLRTAQVMDRCVTAYRA